MEPLRAGNIVCTLRGQGFTSHSTEGPTDLTKRGTLLNY